MEVDVLSVANCTGVGGCTLGSCVAFVDAWATLIAPGCVVAATGMSDEVVANTHVPHRKRHVAFTIRPMPLSAMHKLLRARKQNSALSGRLQGSCAGVCVVGCGVGTHVPQRTLHAALTILPMAPLALQNCLRDSRHSAVLSGMPLQSTCVVGVGSVASGGCDVYGTSRGVSVVAGRVLGLCVVPNGEGGTVAADSHVRHRTLHVVLTMAPIAPPRLQTAWRDGRQNAALSGTPLHNPADGVDSVDGVAAVGVVCGDVVVADVVDVVVEGGVAAVVVVVVLVVVAIVVLVLVVYVDVVEAVVIAVLVLVVVGGA